MWKIILIVSVTVITVDALEAKEKKLKKTLDVSCKDNGADGKGNEVINAVKASVQCIKKVVNLNIIKREIEDAKQSSNKMDALNDVMAGYCSKSKSLKACVHTMTTKFSQCMSNRTRGHIQVYNDVIDALIDYICEKKNGNINIAVFVLDDGIKCVEKNEKRVDNCTELLKNNIFWEHCDDFDKFSECETNIAKRCPKASIGTLISELLKTTRANSPCDPSYTRATPPHPARTTPSLRLKRALSAKELGPADENSTNMISIETKENETDLSLLFGLLDENKTFISKTSYENEADWLWSFLDLFGLQDENSTVIRTAPYENETDWLLQGLRSNDDDDALGSFRLNAQEMTRYRGLMRKYCKNSGGTDEDFNKMLKEMGTCIRCLRNLVDPKRVKVEIEIARPFGRRGMRKIFLKYCQKTWRIKECIYSLTFKTVPVCMADEHENYVTGYNAIIDMTINFWCYQGGDRIALYYADLGPKCFTSQFAKMQECGEVFEGTVFWKNCDKFPKFLDCVTKAMRQCATPHPARIIEALLTVIYRRSICYGGRKKPWATKPPPTGDYNY